MRALVFRLLLPDFAVSVELVTVDPKFDPPPALVSKLLDDHWRAIVLDWEIARDDEDTALDERRGI